MKKKEELYVRLSDIVEALDGNSKALDTIKAIDSYSLNEILQLSKVAEPDEVKEIIDYLNKVVGTHYKHTTAKTKSLINARMREGFSVDDFKEVIDKKSRAWLNDPHMQQFLRPETLFGTKFEGYLNEQSSYKLRGNKPNTKQESMFERIQRLATEGAFEE